MKVFAFDPKTGKRGKEVLGSVNCQATGNRSRATCKLPRHNPADTTWTVADHAEGTRGAKILPEAFGQDAICFCLGQMTAGTDTTWEWVALVKPGTKL